MIGTCYLSLVPRTNDVGEVVAFRIEGATTRPPRKAGFFVKLLLEVPPSAFRQDVKVVIPETAIGMIEVVVEETTSVTIEEEE